MAYMRLGLCMCASGFSTCYPSKLDILCKHRGIDVEITPTRHPLVSVSFHHGSHRGKNPKMKAPS